MNESEVKEAKKKAMRLLQHMDRTSWELQDRLKKAGYSSDAVSAAIAYVSSFHYLDDERYARNFILFHQQQRSLNRMRQDLLKKHIPDEMISRIYEEQELNDSTAIQAAFQKITRGEDEVDAMDYTAKQKLAAKLYRKGFRMGEISELLHM